MHIDWQYNRLIEIETAWKSDSIYVEHRIYKLNHDDLYSGVIITVTARPLYNWQTTGRMTYAVSEWDGKARNDRDWIGGSRQWLKSKVACHHSIAVKRCWSRKPCHQWKMCKGKTKWVQVQSPKKHPYCRTWDWMRPDQHRHAEYDLIGRMQWT